MKGYEYKNTFIIRFLINQVITLWNTVQNEAHIFYAAVGNKHVGEFTTIYFLVSITSIDVSVLTQVSKF